jgi:RepB DNA-primase from phage plasmid
MQGCRKLTVLQTSPGHLQAWVHVRSTPLLPAVVTAIGKQLALAYGGDRASTDWRHLGRLAGFTNQKRGGSAPASPHG